MKKQNSLYLKWDKFATRKLRSVLAVTVIASLVGAVITLANAQTQLVSINRDGANGGNSSPLLAMLALSFGSPSAVHAASITVNTTDDELNSDGDCSLREAITAANTNAAVDACTPGVPGADTITFSVTGTITLGSTLPSITDRLTIPATNPNDGGGGSFRRAPANALPATPVNFSLAASSTGCPTPGFAAATNFGAGSFPFSVAVGDFNLDGKPDLAVANAGSNNVSVLLGNGSGGFGAATNFGAGTNPFSVAVGDFNLDGKPDVATANRFSHNVSVLLGDGSGSFGAATNFGVASATESVAVGDFNLDGKPDLAVANDGSDNVSVLLGNGSGGFGAATNFGVGTIPRSVAVGDFNLDGKPDLAAANAGSDNVSVLLGNGSGGFGAATNFGVGNFPQSVAVGDFNLDGKPDLATAGYFPDNVSVLLGNGSGGFGAATNFGTGSGPQSVAVGDFNLDGKPDVATANRFSNNVSVLLGDGSGGFGAATNFFSGLGPQSVAVGDFNLDGKPDLAAANLFGNNVSVLLNTCTSNTAPVAEAGGPYNVNEGGSITVTASGTDPENGPLTYAWDLDNNGSFETPGQSVTFSAAALDGPTSLTITVQVTDNGGLTATDEATVNVLNVAPTAGFVNTSGAIIKGQSATLAFSNQFDPSAADLAAGFRYSYDCTNDGAFELSDASATSHACAYPASGAFTARGRIKDKDGGFTDYTVAVIVLTPQQAIGTLIDKVRALVAAGILNQGQGNALIAKLEAAIQQLDRGNVNPAINQLQAFINQVNAFIRAGVLSPAEGQSLIDAANEIIAVLNG